MMLDNAVEPTSDASALHGHQQLAGQGLRGGAAWDTIVKSAAFVYPRTGFQAFLSSHNGVSAAPQYAQLGDKLIQLVAGDEEYEAIAGKFFAGPGMLPHHFSVTGIYRDSHSSNTGQARRQAFERQKLITADLRGDANVRFGWHGTSRKGVQGIILHGFGQPSRPKNGACYGNGVYLSPENYSNLSAMYSDIDENGEQHVVLCQVIMGVSELVPLGSQQFHPCSEEFDTGVDDSVDPKRYIIWSTHMNSHILPRYVISFRPSKLWLERVEECRAKHKLGNCFATDKPLFAQVQHRELDGCGLKPSRKPKLNVPDLRMSFPELFCLLKSELPPANLILLKQKYLNFKAGKMSRIAWAKCLRVLIGDKKLVTAIKALQRQRPTDAEDTKKPNNAEYTEEMLSLTAVPCPNARPKCGGVPKDEVL